MGALGAAILVVGHLLLTNFEVIARAQATPTSLPASTATVPMPSHKGTPEPTNTHEPTHTQTPASTPGANSHFYPNSEGPLG